VRFPNARVEVFLSIAAVLALVPVGVGQTNSNDRVFSQPKPTVERALKDLQSLMAGQLPVLEGFALATDQPLDRYRRAYYQSTVQVSSTASGGTIVRVNTKVTAWYTDPNSSRSGYRLLPSNGRLEAELLDQLTERLATLETGVKASSAKAMPVAQPRIQSAETQPNISAPMPRLPETGGTFSSSLAQSLAAHDRNDSAEKKSGDDSSLKAEAQNLEEILKNQAHPTNLVAVKKSGTPVVATSSLNAKTLFLASAHDEFEILGFNSDWVHVRISGLSRGWIWRNNLEMPGNIPDAPAQSVPVPAAPAAELFHVSREESAPFPGDWEPLRGKTVKIISVQKADETAKDIAITLRLEFAKSVLDKSYGELTKSPEFAGVVLIFDSADGGMIAATLSTLQQWKAGKLSDAALWHQCFFDPPETLSSPGAPGSE
jgi:hypothetical protein